MEITAFGFAQSIITVMRGVLRPTRQATVEYQDAAIRYFPVSHNIQFSTRDAAMQYIYRPCDAAITAMSRLVGRIQNGNINLYVLYVFITLVGLLIGISFGII